MQHKKTPFIHTVIHGSSGRMGAEVASMITKTSFNDFTYLGGIDQSTDKDNYLALLRGAQLFIDFSTPEASLALFENLQKHSIEDKKILLCTTGFSSSQLSQIEDISKKHKLSVMQAPNTSLGVLSLYKVALELASTLVKHDFDIEIVESHHKRKKDAPSGTAKFLADGISKVTNFEQVSAHPRTEPRNPTTVGVHAVRGGGIFGEHEIRFISDVEEVTIMHRALSRSLFAKGALIIARALSKKAPGFYQYGDLELGELS